MLLSLSAKAGWLINGRVIDSEGKVVLHRIFIQDQLIKVERYNLIYICDLQKQTLILIDPENLVFCRTSLKSYADATRRMMSRRLEPVMAGIAAEGSGKELSLYQHKIDSIGILPPPAAQPVECTLVEDSVKLGGHITEKYQFNISGLKKEEIWIADIPGLKNALNRDAFYPFLALVEKQGEMVRYMQTPGYSGLLEKGFPVRRMIYSQGVRTEWQVNKFEEKAIPAYEFMNPALCKEITVQDWLERTGRTDYLEDDYE